MDFLNNKEIIHLYWRAGFGPQIKDIKRLLSKNKKEIIHELFIESQNNDFLKLDLSEFSNIDYFKIQSNEKKFLEIQKRSQIRLRELRDLWMKNIFESQAVLREKMVLFWSNHFVCREDNVELAIRYHNLIRKHALGNFRDFVKGVSKEPAMIRYLNLNASFKQAPNENFARELMELFTLGEGNYKEKDIKEASRAFTGYNHKYLEGFYFNETQHDNKVKIFFNKKGFFTGDDIINIILEQKHCARFISEKIYKFFVNPRLNTHHVEEMTEVFYKNYDISELMKFVFLSDWFYDKENIGVKVKSPIDLIAGIYKKFPFQLQRKRELLDYLKSLGQVPLKPRNVSGWKGGVSWIDSKTINIRLGLASALFSNSRVPLNNEINVNEKHRKKASVTGVLFIPYKNTHDWEDFENEFKDFEINDIQDFVLACSIKEATKNKLKTYTRVSKRQYFVQLLSTLEYQMC